MPMTTVARTDPPRVDVTATALPDGVSSVQLVRQSGGDSWTVRGAAEALAGTGMVVTDWEVPPDIPVTYVLTYWNASGQMLGTLTSQVTVAGSLGPSELWLSDPLDQSSPMRVAALRGTDESREMAVDAQSALPFGSRWPILSVRSRRAMDQWPVTLLATDPAQAAQIRGLLEQALVLCVRTPSWSQLPPVMYGVFGCSETPYPNGGWFSTFGGTMQLGRASTLAPTIYAWTYDDLLATSASYNAVLSSYPTYNDVIKGQ